MKIADTAGSWCVEGMHVATFPAEEVVDDHALLAYYNVCPGCKHYEPLRQAIRFDRYVLLKEDSTFIIVPMNPSLFVVVEP